MSTAMCCEACGTFAPTDAPDRSNFEFHTPLPIGWLRIHVEDRNSKAKEDRNHPPVVGEVCSRACASKWLEGVMPS